MKKRNLPDIKKWLQWVLDFIQMDLNSMSPSQSKKLFLEATYFSDYDYFEKLGWDEFEEFFGSGHRDIDKGLEILKLQTGLKQFLEKLENMIFQKDEFIELPETSSILRVNTYPEIYGDGDLHKWRSDFDISYSLKDDSLLNRVILSFSKLIEGLDCNSIMKCKTCGRYFFNPTERKKLYCNSVCASRFVAHRRYEELKQNPEKYERHLKKYRKLSRQRYERLRKEMYGPNVKIQRRKRKEV